MALAKQAKTAVFSAEIEVRIYRMPALKVLNQLKVFFKKTTNMIQDPIVNQHEHMIFVIISKQIESLSPF